MATISIEASLRENSGKGVARKLRQEGRLPAVMYGVGESTPLSLNLREFTHMMQREGGNHALIELTITGGKKVETKGVIVRDAQVHPVTGELTHCDLYEVQKGHKVTVTVGVHIIGDTPAGVREQGILQHNMHEMELDCLPNAIPDSIEVDASALQIGESLHVRDLTLPEGVHPHVSEDATVVSVLAPKVVSEEEVTAEGEAAEGEAAEAAEGEAAEGESEGSES
ncbi:MAG: 50S ribosomal protein L25 [Leptospirillia bacterium]